MHKIANAIVALIIASMWIVPAYAQMAVLPMSPVTADCTTLTYTAGKFVGSYVDTTGNSCGSAVDSEFQAVDTPTVQNAAYSSGNCMGGFRPLTVSRTASGGIIISAFSVRSVSGITPTVQVYLFSSSPSASTCTDKSTFTINSADVDKVIAGGVFLVGLAQPVGSTPSFGSVSNLALSAKADASSQITYAIVATATTTPGSTTDLHVAINGIQD